jgi:hypothetical protein
MAASICPVVGNELSVTEFVACTGGGRTHALPDTGDAASSTEQRTGGGTRTGVLSASELCFRSIRLSGRLDMNGAALFK